MAPTQLRTVKPYLVWMWNHGTLDIYEFDTEAEAITYALDVEDSGDGSLKCIEGPDSLVAQAAIEAEHQRRSKRSQAEWAERPRYTHRVDVTPPDGRGMGRLSWHTSHEDAMEAYIAAYRRFGERAGLVTL